MRRFASLILLSTLIATAAFAADSGSGKIRLDSAVKVGTTELPAGEYKVTWTGSGTATEVTLTQGKTKVTLPAQVVEVRRKSDAVSTRNENGSVVLTEIQFQKETLVLQNAPSQVAGQ
jgi:YD repeat-containing protein